MSPIREYRNRFNIWTIDSFYTDGQLDKPVVYEYILSRCSFQNHQMFTINADHSGLAEILMGLDSRDQPSTHLAHEMGHLLGDLDDEYGGLGDPRCDLRANRLNPLGATLHNNVYWASEATNTLEGCRTNAAWSHWIGSCYQNGRLFLGNCPSAYERVDCYYGARYCRGQGYYWRPAYETIMGAPQHPSRYHFSLVDISALCNSFVDRFGETRGICRQLPLEGCPPGQRVADPDGDGIGECLPIPPVTLAVAITSPLEDQTIDQTVLAPIPIRATVTGIRDPSEVELVRFEQDQGIVLGEDRVPPYESVLPTEVRGVHTFYARAVARERLAFVLDAQRRILRNE
jgi:hypothetical protein